MNVLVGIYTEKCRYEKHKILLIQVYLSYGEWMYVYTIDLLIFCLCLKYHFNLQNLILLFLRINFVRIGGCCLILVQCETYSKRFCWYPLRIEKSFSWCCDKKTVYSRIFKVFWKSYNNQKNTIVSARSLHKNF